MEDLKNCPLCHNHCPIDSPKCSRGKELAEQIQAGAPVDLDAMMKQPEHGKDHRHGHRGPKDYDSLEGLLRECGHVLHHGGGKDDLFAGLTAEEQAELKALLQKLIAGWK